MPRLATTTDAFNAIAEPRRRQIIDLLALGQILAVSDLVKRLGIPQPAVSKHLAVLRKVGVVMALRAGQQRLYRLNGEELKPVHDWVKGFEHFWTNHLANIKERAERKAQKLQAERKPK